ncbi:DNA cytosine methyltransferase [Streptomyces massasporeus]|uniref:DNA cytosine methyltransferase n=1 Tax=Streptomyces massasporeus TaxID=67324 RepID=UPI0033EFAB06
MAVQAVFGGESAWVADNDPGAALILAHHHSEVPNLGDITAVDWRDVKPVDIYIGGYPCQPFSTAGKRKGTKDARHLWPHIARALGVLRPRYAVFENVANHLRLGFDTVLCDLADLGFDVEWCVVRADDVGACHQRRRLIFLATAADAPHLGHERSGGARRGRPGPANSDLAAANAASNGRREGRPEPAGQQGRPGTALGRGAVAPDAQGGRRTDGPVSGPELQFLAELGTGGGAGERRGAEGTGEPGGSSPVVAWGQYAPAIARWEAVTSRRAPWATDDRGRLSPAFVEWMMGLDTGHVTAVPGLSRAAQLKALGNGVVPLQAASALRLLLHRAEPDASGRAAA